MLKEQGGPALNEAVGAYYDFFHIDAPWWEKTQRACSQDEKDKWLNWVAAQHGIPEEEMRRGVAIAEEYRAQMPSPA